MKKTYRLFCTVCMAGALAFLASSCKKNEEQTTIKVSLPEFEQIAGDPDDLDRMYVDFNDGSMYWNGFDEVMMYNIDNEGKKTQKGKYVAPATAEGQRATVLGFVEGQCIVDKEDKFFAFYPACKIHRGITPLDETNREYFDVPRVQNYTTTSAGVATLDPTSMAMAVEIPGNRLDVEFQLQHIFGVCRLRLQGNATVDSIVLVDNKFNLYGDVSMKLHAVNSSTFTTLQDRYSIANLEDLNSSFFTLWNAFKTDLGYLANGEGRELVLNCHSEDAPNGVALNPSAVTPFYISVRPGAFMYGFNIVVYHDGGKAVVVNKYATGDTERYRIKAGTIVGFKPTNAINYNTEGAQS